ncbi:putative bifunctional diguanylate cyclase/phosphodiesterase [Nocardioides mangrovi]|uniref:Bifunctional diguanylate cyclase/phosphodiesterase n=1 Tax=Nocardioides mangrovi TaxID=2874580 RepID=A0ABS7UID5_9ACTN|nr:bifunctional diguanylate cyclase/phosphodiesterase [Nocardioides mangrovi]MBZ5740031.1 bifunctional diguanylate cyclase/phosphodiesterase [Nocardioides mangrovi]MBZ5740798.1 bifunctional diguanylate cyclase/phosphodiesterase [Nocardioides mangrovi]
MVLATSLLAAVLVVAGAVVAVAVAAVLRRPRRDTPRPEPEPSRPGAPAASTNDGALDSVTRLPHRDLLTQRGPSILAAAAAAGGDGVIAVLLFDLDRFKTVNDGAGHHIGDQVLAEIGARTRSCLLPGEIAVRLGGDEFAMLVGPLPPGREVDDRVRQLLTTLSAPVFLDGLRISVGVSLGVSIAGTDGDDLDELLQAADQAMYVAKAAGPGQWRRSESPPHGIGSHRLRDDLAAAVGRGELTLHYQPQVDSRTGRVTGFEALVRWHHAELGLLLPSQFVPMAERTGLIADITTFTLDAALSDHARLASLAPGCTVSVNISARTMFGEDLVHELEELLDRHRVAPADLVLEVPGPSPRPTLEVLGLFASLGRLGCGVSVHGFGSTHSSLGALWHYPAVREAKIDPTVIQALDQTPGTERLVRALIAGVRGLEVRAVAEGVDSPVAARRLCELGADALQGNWIGPATPLAGIRDWMRQWAATPAAWADAD